MATITRVVGTRTEVLSSTLNSIAADTYVTSSGIDLTSVNPIDVIVDAAFTPGTPAGDKAMLVFAKVAIDGGTNFTSGPESSTSPTDEPNLYLLGVVPVNSVTTQQRGAFSVFAALGFIPTDMKIVVRNRSGATLGSSGHSVGWTPITGTVA